MICQGLLGDSNPVVLPQLSKFVPAARDHRRPHGVEHPVRQVLLHFRGQGDGPDPVEFKENYMA